MQPLARWVYAVAASVFVLGVFVQVYLVGLVIVAGRIGFASHVALGHALALPVLLMAVCAHVGRLPRGTVRLTWALVAVYVVQADVLMVLRSSAPYLAALHPVLALADVVIGLLLVRAGWSLVGQVRAEARRRAVAASS